MEKQLTIADVPIIIKFLNKNVSEISELIFLELLRTNKLKFENLTKKYVRYLEEQNIKQNNKLRLFAHSLASKYQMDDVEYLNARDSIMLDPFVPKDFIDKYIPKTTKSELEKQQKFLDREINRKHEV